MICTILLLALGFAQSSDADIKTCVEQRLGAAKSLAGERITVSVKDGLVTLTGSVSDSRKKATATRVARGLACAATEADNRLEAKRKLNIRKPKPKPVAPPAKEVK